MLSSSTESSKEDTSPLNRLLSSISSYDSNVMLAAVISLLLVILFVLLLHIYARWFLAQAHRRRQTSMSVSNVLRPTATRFHHFHSFNFDAASSLSNSPSKGLDSTAISSIPLFFYTSNGRSSGLELECVICLSNFEEGDAGRILPKCGHGFHVECIDMWLKSHTSCPICRAPVLVADEIKNGGHENLADPDGNPNAEVAVEVVTNNADRRDHPVGLVNEELQRGNNEVPSISDQNNQNVGVNEICDSLYSSSSPSSSSGLGVSSSLIGCSLKRMLSRNRSERKIFPSSDASELDV